MSDPGISIAERQSVVFLRLPPKMHDELRELASKNHRTVTAQMRYLLDVALQAEQARGKKR